MRYFLNKKLIFTVSIATVLTFLIGWTVKTHQLSEAKNDFLSEEEYFSQEIIAVYEEEVSRVLLDLFFIRDYLLDNISLQSNNGSLSFMDGSDKDRLIEGFELLANKRPEYSEIKIVDSSNHHFIALKNTSSKPVIEESMTAELEQSFIFGIETLEHNDIYITNTVNDGIGSMDDSVLASITVATPFRDEEGTELGTLLLEYNMEHLFDRVAVSAHKFNVSLLQESGNPIFLSTEEQEVDINQTLPNDSFFYQSAEDNQVLTLLKIDESRLLADLEEGSLYSVSFTNDCEPYVWSITLNKNAVSELKDIQKEYLTVTIASWVVAMIVILYIDSLGRSRKEKLEELNYKSNYDLMTDSMSKMSAFEMMEGWIENKTPFTMIFIDFDDFKIINDTMGHHYGDYVLQEFVRRVKTDIRTSDVVARFGGDEFFVLLKDMKQYELIDEKCKRILARLAMPMIQEDHLAHISVSIGAVISSEYEQSKFTRQDIMRYSDELLYTIKEKGKNNYKIGHIHKYIKDKEI